MSFHLLNKMCDYFLCKLIESDDLCKVIKLEIKCDNIRHIIKNVCLLDKHSQISQIKYISHEHMHSRIDIIYSSLKRMQGSKPNRTNYSHAIMHQIVCKLRLDVARNINNCNRCNET
jgi:hypothetical protein